MNPVRARKIEENLTSEEQDAILEGFSKKLFSDQTDIPVEFAEVLEEHFWELVN